MSDAILVVGGCKSGKSARALELALATGAKDRIFVATCVARDDEMDERVARHQAERAGQWRTIEEPLDVAGVVRDNARPGTVILLDCLTLWVTNLLIEGRTKDDAVEEADRLADALEQAGGPVVVVSNEVGAGIVPENALARAFRDAAGMVNQRIAQAAEKVVWCVAGIPVVVKENGRNMMDGSAG
ncbi:MAG: bifunctional adenosylcobinamide kinase/adenosylcobinamide-phosphate guanylyltransferase [Desulfatibacillaceae bacterium]